MSLVQTLNDNLKISNSSVAIIHQQFENISLINGCVVVTFIMSC